MYSNTNGAQNEATDLPDWFDYRFFNFGIPDYLFHVCTPKCISKLMMLKPIKESQ